MIDSLSIAVHGFVSRVSMAFSVEVVMVNELYLLIIIGDFDSYWWFHNFRLI